MAWDILELYDPGLDYPTGKLKGINETKNTELISKVVKAIEKNTPFPEGLSKPLLLFMESRTGRGLWQELFEKGYPDTIYCVDKEIVGKTKVYHFRYALNGDRNNKLTAIFNEKDELAQLLWW